MDTPPHSNDLIDYTRYPINQDGAERATLLARIRTDLNRDGCAVLKQFLTPQGIAALSTEAEGVTDQGHRSHNRTNVYFTKDDPALSPEDPRRRFFDRSNAFVPADNFAKDGALRTYMTALVLTDLSRIVWKKIIFIATPTLWPISSSI